ncbi:MAG: hypothetical protein KJO95_00795 [Gammaproteobacteria bacterium]|nr:hypothetical protein [Gammaproteobacteria bacterium]NNC57547.1 hypothetical protein [Woeseiaceae bacterium]
MGNIVAIVSIALALVAAGSIAYIAWELTSEDKPTEKPEADDLSDHN